jgi:hypothetical protein
MFIPELIFQLFGAAGNETAYFVARRTSMFFMGYAIISFYSRTAQPSTIRQAISLGIALSMLGLSILGIFEFVHGSVGIGVFLAVSLEVFWFVSYSSIWLSDRREKSIAKI